MKRSTGRRPSCCLAYLDLVLEQRDLRVDLLVRRAQVLRQLALRLDHAGELLLQRLLGAPQLARDGPAARPRTLAPFRVNLRSGPQLRSALAKPCAPLLLALLLQLGRLRLAA